MIDEYDVELVVDRLACVGSLWCTQSAPEVFQMDGDGLAEISDDASPDAADKDIQEAIAGCPTRAISWRPAGQVAQSDS